MRTSWFAGFALLAALAMLISSTTEGAYLGQSDNNVFWLILNPTFASETNALLAIGGFFIWLIDWVRALWTIFIWDYAFLEGSWDILRTFGWAISTAMVVSIVLAIRGTGSG